jgi:hypothetical protein
MAAVEANSPIMLTTASVGIPYVATITGGTGFTLKSTSGSDTAVKVAWYVVESSRPEPLRRRTACTWRASAALSTR